MSRRRDAIARRKKAERLKFFGRKYFRPSLLGGVDGVAMDLRIPKWMRRYIRLHNKLPTSLDEWGNLVSDYGTARISRHGTGFGSPVDSKKPLYAALSPEVFRARNGHDRAQRPVPDTPPRPQSIEGNFEAVMGRVRCNGPHPLRDSIPILGCDK